MNILKRIVKFFIRLLIKIKIIFHKGCTNRKDEKAFDYLNNLYPMKEYDLNNVVKQSDGYDYDLSIIVPVYNNEKYLNECIDSLLNQHTDYLYEVICIDDGSNDSSLKILKEYDDERLKVVHQDNQGISAARNAGLLLAKGRYVGFVDNDDYVLENYVEILMDNVYRNDLDYLKCSYQVFCDKSLLERKIYANKVLDNLDDISDYDNWLHGYMWGGCYKKDIWNQFCFPKSYWYEDMIRNMYLYDCCKRIGSIDDVVYFKRKHDSNAADVIWKKSDLKCLDQLYLAYQLYDLKKQRNINSNNLSKCALLLEMSEYLYKRTLNLDEDIRKASFDVACDMFYDNDIKIDDNIYKKALKAFENRDFKLYNLLGQLIRYK